MGDPDLRPRERSPPIPDPARRSVKDLPEAYEMTASFDIAKRKVLAVALNALAAVSIFGFAALFLTITWLLRPSLEGFSLQISLARGGFWLAVLRVTILSFVMVVLHEGAHGIVFRIINGEWGTFAFKGLYAYAAAPGWYMPRNQHILAALAPVLGLSLVGVIMILVVPQGWLPTVLLLLILHAAGSVGDLAIVVWLLTKPRSVYVADYGDGVAVYASNPG